MSSVVMLRRYPLKSAQGEALTAVEVEPTGLRGDRTWACIDRLDGTVGSAKHPRRWGRLCGVAATTHVDGAETTVTLDVDGTSLRAGSAAADAALSRHLGRPVRLSRELPPDARLHRTLPDEVGMVPDWMSGTRPGQETITTIAGTERVGRFVDFGAVHIVTTGALDLLGQRIGGASVAAARFRPNLVIDAPGDPEPGQELRLGDVVLRVTLPTPRCVIPGLPQADLPADRSVLSALARHYRVPVAGLGHAACFGTYADVVQPGRLRLGQRVR
ncbi:MULTISPECIES: MOSC domain-containing protein [Micromonospora]|uniref:MOSC domain-containing protein n=1 Tax=Micromonospora TaxID=1873 RepID=UPI001B379696|nr:MOSC domain-containing protein [Micromonospora sp. M61]MBQ0978380.1 MOSC domain-containing protein [Micromonospora sp. M61]WTI18621.1 MOSC domain-containing protein [Micromonospora zamorensis]